MENSEEFYDAFETIEQLNESLFIDEDKKAFNTDRPKRSDLPIVDLAEYKTDINISTNKTELFSWTTLNLVKKTGKDIKEFSGLEIIQEVKSKSNINWILKFSPDNKYFISAGDSQEIQFFEVSNYFSEKSLNLLVNEEIYTGHEGTVVAVEWDQGSEMFISSGIDCLVLLWKVGHTIPIKQFLHEHIVTSLGFSPQGLFFTGSLSKKLCFWSLPEGKVENTYQIQGLITCAKFSQDGTILAVGLSQGECIFYEVNNAVITYITQVNCKNRKGFKSSGKKVTGIDYQDDQYVVISTNDSRIRLFSLENFSLVQKYKGGKSEQFPIGASFSHNFGHVIRGSEDGFVFIWNTFKIKQNKRWSIIRDQLKNGSYEFFCLAKGCSHAIFASSEVIKKVQSDLAGSEIIVSHILVVANGGKIYVLFNQFKNVPW